jgi:hypothetical protein
MSKDFIPYQEALELKELGFDEPCFAFYNYNSQLCRYMNPDKDWNSLNHQQLKNSKITLPDTHTAPTYSQAFRWFREEHDLDYSLLPESSSGHKLSTRTFNIVIYKYYMNMNVQAETVRIDGKIARYNKREEAELACLKKLIQIVKENKQ